MRSRRNAPALPTSPPADDATSAPPAAHGVMLSPAQQETLLTARAWWQEGDRALDYLAEQSQRSQLFGRLRPLLEDLRNDPTAQTVQPVLLLVRQLTTNGALNRTLYTDAFARSLRDLLYGVGPLSNRLHVFLQTAHVGPQTASHLLFAAFPERYPLVSKQTRALLAPTSAQTREARNQAKRLYRSGEMEEESNPTSGNGQAQSRKLLTDFVLYETVRDFLQAETFDTLHGILWHAREIPPASQTKSRRTKASLSVVRESMQNNYAIQINDGMNAAPRETATENELLRTIEHEIESAGFTFAPLVVRRYYVSLKTKPFVILSGLSGTGKTRLTNLFARALCGQDEHNQYLLIPVRPDWASSDALLGYHNLLTDHYVSTPFLSLLQKAALPENRDRTFFVCLDEMNLARVEHYFSDVLSAMETTEGRIPLHEDKAALLPSNVFLTGSVNMDEATYPFSRKVLDRANTIEFSNVSFGDTEEAASSQSKGDFSLLPFPARQKLFLSRRVLSVRAAHERMAAFDTDMPARVTQTLTQLNTILAPRQMHFGYRVRDEVLRYVAASFDVDGTGLFAPTDAAANETIALDTQILQKVLPRVAGTHETLQRLLAELQSWANQRGFTETAAKLRGMQARGEETGLVSFYDL